METKDLKKIFKDLTVAKLTMDAVYSRRAIEEMMTKQFGNSVLRYEHYGKKVNVAISSTYGKFVEQLKPGTKVVMTGAEIELKPEYAKKVWKVTTPPQFMCGEIVVWLEGFSGAYSCEMLRLPEPDEDLPFLIHNKTDMYQDENAIKLSKISSVTYDLIIEITKITVLSSNDLLEFYLIKGRFPTVEEMNVASKVGFSALYEMTKLIKD